MKASIKTVYRYIIYITILVPLLSGVIILLFPYHWIGKYVFQQLHHVRKADVVVVLFGDENENGTGAGRETHRRVSHGVKLLRRGYAKHIIFSGGTPQGA